MPGLNSNVAAICRKLTSENGKLKHEGFGVVSVIWAVVYNVVAYVLMLISCLTPNLRLRNLLQIVNDGKLNTKKRNSSYISISRFLSRFFYTYVFTYCHNDSFNHVKDKKIISLSSTWFYHALDVSNVLFIIEYNRMFVSVYIMLNREHITLIFMLDSWCPHIWVDLFLYFNEILKDFTISDVVKLSSHWW